MPAIFPGPIRQRVWHLNNSSSIRSRGARPAETLPKTAIYCHLLPFCSLKTATAVSTDSFGKRTQAQTSNPIARISARALLCCDDTGPHAIIEQHLAVLEPVFEVDVHDLGRELVGDLGQGQVVGGHEADRAQVDQAADDPFGADASIVRVGAVEELVKQEEQRQRSAGTIDHLAHPGDLGVKPRAAGLERILDAERGADGQGREVEPRGTHRCSGQGEHRVDSHGAQQGALARHVRAAHDQDPRHLAERDVVAHANRRLEQRVADRFGLEARGPSTSSGNGSAGFSAAYDASAQSASNSPIASSQWPISRPDPARQASIRSASWIVQSQMNGKGHEELVPLVIEQLQQPGQSADLGRGGQSVGLE